MYILWDIFFPLWRAHKEQCLKVKGNIFNLKSLHVVSASPNVCVISLVSFTIIWIVIFGEHCWKPSNVDILLYSFKNFLGSHFEGLQLFERQKEIQGTHNLCSGERWQAHKLISTQQMTVTKYLIKYKGLVKLWQLYKVIHLPHFETAYNLTHAL